MANRRRVRVPGVNGGRPGTAPRIAGGVERGGSRRAAFNPNQVIEDQAAKAEQQRRLWASGNNGNDQSSYPGYNVPGTALPRGVLPNSENIPNSRYFGDPFVENIEADLFSRSDNAQGDFIPLTYAPTKTAFPGNGWDHRRTIAAGYSVSQGILRVKFYTDGAIYDYGIDQRVPPAIAKAFRLAQSPGRFINTTLEDYGYTRIN
jgi:KTSC domain